MTDQGTTPTAHPPELGIVRLLISKPEFGPLVLLVLMIVVFTSINPAFASITNIGNALTFTVELGLIALAMTLLMTAGEFDLSVGSVFGFAPVMMWAFFNAGLMPLWVAFVVALLIALAIGLVSGLFVTRLGIPSFLVTLGMLLVVRGSALWLTSGFPQRTWDAHDQWLSNVLVGDFYIGGLRVYMSLIWFILLAAACHYLLTRTRFGNWIQATGGNPSAARNRGVPTQRVKVILFMLSAAMAAFAGIISSELRLGL
jgi:simple sugar transport system permease protein